MKSFLTLFSSALLLLTAFAFADEIATMRDKVAIDQDVNPQYIPKVTNDDIKQARNYPMQPPVIPHTDRNYEVNLNVNKCMSCHARNRTGDSQAPMVSVTHYMDRDGNFLAEISPRRYFCNQCHVPQLDTQPKVDNEFVDMHKIMAEKAAKPEGQ
ncbi:nitrate reductase cytochrome c-type subunit [Thalassotalea mangrovi]|uniref:Periplasmic nitrate reductase, electron transfer subunit n=1 Tax=Thalassotalea mangrovi TaxID=2572245 RepID=A0A4U1BBK2_9GAMM|nr:nitrate reductase cytochrome c-type subunit [Thalassotalea mangrovi]TKB47399.1 nitrate reductase cytochrome c-type subunit [Thalassotalea mangrovi]